MGCGLDANQKVPWTRPRMQAVSPQGSLGWRSCARRLDIPMHLASPASNLDQAGADYGSARAQVGTGTPQRAEAESDVDLGCPCPHHTAGRRRSQAPGQAGVGPGSPDRPTPSAAWLAVSGLHSAPEEETPGLCPGGQRLLLAPPRLEAHLAQVSSWC